MRGPDAAMITVLIVIGVIAFAVGLTIQIFFLLTLSRCLTAIKERNRDMEPGLVWLNLIPCVNLVWIFFIIIKIGSSLRNEYRYRRWNSSSESFGVSVGLAYAILLFAGFVPYIGFIFSIASFVCWIIYWVQIAGYTSKLNSRPSRRRSAEDELDDEYDDDDFDRLPPRRERREAVDDDGEPDQRIRRGRGRNDDDERDERDERYRARPE